MRRASTILLATAAAGVLCGCRSPICPWCGHDIRTTPPVKRAEYLPAGIVEGEVTSLERGELHPLARIEIQLLDLSIFAGGQPRLIAETTIDQPTSLPVPFTLEYPADTLDTTHDFSVSAQIMVGNNEIFKTDTRYPVLTRGAPSRVQIVVMRIRK